MEDYPRNLSELEARFSTEDACLLGTHQGAVSAEHLDYYLDEFSFRFNRRTSTSRGKLFYRLMEQAVQIPACPYKNLIAPEHNG